MRRLELEFTSDNIPKFLVEIQEFLLEAVHLGYFKLTFKETYPEITSILPEEKDNAE